MCSSTLECGTLNSCTCRVDVPRDLTILLHCQKHSRTTRIVQKHRLRLISAALWTKPTRATSPALVPTPASHSRRSSSCEPRSRCTSSARSCYAKPTTTTPGVAGAATNEQPETWGQNTTATLWSWVQSNSKVSSGNISGEQNKNRWNLKETLK